jgi:hypothetical protein
MSQLAVTVRPPLEDRLDVNLVRAVVVSDDRCHRSATFCERERVTDPDWPTHPESRLKETLVYDEPVVEVAVRDFGHGTDRTPPPRFVS